MTREEIDCLKRLKWISIDRLIPMRGERRERRELDYMLDGGAA
jgi:hypothetical protein